MPYDSKKTWDRIAELEAQMVEKEKMLEGVEYAIKKAEEEAANKSSPGVEGRADAKARA